MPPYHFMGIFQFSLFQAWKHWIVSVLIIVGFSYIENRENSVTQVLMPRNPFKMNGILHRRDEIWSYKR